MHCVTCTTAVGNCKSPPTSWSRLYLGNWLSGGRTTALVFLLPVLLVWWQMRRLARFSGLRRTRFYGNPEASHLVILVHGFMSRDEPMHQVGQLIVQKLPTEGIPLCVYVANANNGWRDGGSALQNQAAKLASEIACVVRSCPNVAILSVVGVSLGGVVSRLAIPLLSEAVLKRVRLGLFASVGSPHVGIRGFQARWLTHLARVIGYGELCDQMTSPRSTVLGCTSGLEGFTSRSLFYTTLDQRVPAFSASITRREEVENNASRPLGGVPVFSATSIPPTSSVATSTEEAQIITALRLLDWRQVEVKTRSWWVEHLPFLRHLWLHHEPHFIEHVTWTLSHVTHAVH